MLALAEIAVLALLIAATIVVFTRRSVMAAALMVPHLLWVDFAGHLNADIVFNN